MAEAPPELARCNECGFVLIPEEDDAHNNWCPGCEMDLEVRLDDTFEGRLTHDEFTRRMTPEIIQELIPMMIEYLEDVEGEAEIWATHIPYEDDLPAGYTEQERFIPVIGYRFGTMEKYLITEGNAEETIEALQERYT